jgi:hypothetical protein
MEAAARRRLKLAQSLRSASIEEEARSGPNRESQRLEREYRNALGEVVKLYPKSAAAIEAEKLRWER